MVKTLALEPAYQACETLAYSHYENFPVASIFLPRRIRRAVCVIYAFARTVDDIADEGTASIDERLGELSLYEHALTDLGNNINAITIASTTASTESHGATLPIFLALKDVILQYNLPVSLFLDLLQAFKQDVIKNEHDTLEAIMDYCKHSANPVGRLLLHLTQTATPENLSNSDAICTALQLINFMQDLDSDLHKRNRCYIPLSEMQSLQVTRWDLLQGKETPEIHQLIEQQLSRAQALLTQGSPLGNRLKGLFGFEIRLIIQGGQLIVNKLIKRKNLYRRPTLKPWHWPILIWRALRSLELR